MICFIVFNTLNGFQVFQAHDVGNGLIPQLLLRDVLTRAGCSALLVEKLFELSGVQGDSPVPYVQLVNWLFALEKAPGAQMAPVELTAVPVDSRSEVALQTLLLLVAAASWSLRGSQGEVRIEESPSTPDAFLGFSIASKSLADSEDLAERLSRKVQVGKVYNEVVIL